MHPLSLPSSTPTPGSPEWLCEIGSLGQRKEKESGQSVGAIEVTFVVGGGGDFQESRTTNPPPPHLSSNNGCPKNHYTKNDPLNMTEFSLT